MIVTLTKQTQINTPSIATIGFFDGVHRGHQFLIESMKAKATELHLGTMAITFDVHPRHVIAQGNPPELLTTTDERLRLLEQMGIDNIIVLPFNSDMARMTSKEFIQRVMTQINVKQLLLGYDNRFGSDRASTLTDYVRFGLSVGIIVERAEPFFVGDTAVSSSRVRRLLQIGDVSGAALCLGRSYNVAGTVTDGFHEGHRLGFPTANIIKDALKALPSRGVYATLSEIEGDKKKWFSMTNIGIRPTFQGHRQTIETHLIDFSGDIYGQRLNIEFVSRLRDERPFELPESLAHQLETDRQQAREACSKYLYNLEN